MKQQLLKIELQLSKVEEAINKVIQGDYVNWPLILQFLDAKYKILKRKHYKLSLFL